MGRTVYDIMILGATPAGFSAALTLGKAKINTLLLDVPSHSPDCPLLDWAPKDLFNIPGLPKSIGKETKTTPFKTVRYHSVALDNQVEHKFSSGPAGYFLNSSDLVQVLHTAADKAGVSCRSMKTHPTIQLKEDHVEIHGSREYHGRLVMFAQDQPRDVFSALSIPIQHIPHGELSSVGIDIPLKPSDVKKDLQGILHIVEMPERSEIGMYFATKSNLHIRVISSSRASGIRTNELTQLIGKLQRMELIPSKLALNKAIGASWRPPAGVALELENHIAKRCILVGTAGGFTESVSGHTLTPAIRSALLACDVAKNALQDEGPQEQLSTFKSIWRENMVEYLRPPNTSLPMLLPLLFANQRMVGKFTQALLYGENI